MKRQKGIQLRLMKTNSISDYIVCLALALGLVAAPYYVKTGSCALSFTYFITVIIVFLALLTISALIRKLIVRNVENNKYKNRYLILWDKMLNSKYAFFWLMLIILAFWSPIIISLYPGTLINDTWGQLSEYIQHFNIGGVYSGQLSDHHPFIDTLIMGTIITPFGEKLHNWQLGFFVYTIIQVILTSFSFAATIVYSFKKLKVKSSYLLIICLFYGLCPVFPISAQTISKDALFSWIYVLFILLFIEVIRTQGKCLLNYKYMILLIIVASLCMFTKKVGLYIIGLSLFSIIIFIPKFRVRSSIVLGVVLLISVGLIGGVKSSLNVLPGGKQEMFSIPFQQSARYMREYKNDVTKQEYRAINKLIDAKTAGEKYDPLNADPVKGFADRGNALEFKNYLTSWYQEGIRHPKVYIAAFNAMVSGWFSFEEYLPLTNMGWHSQLDPKLIPESASIRPKLFNAASNVVQSVSDNLYRNSIFQIFLSYAFYASIMPAFIVATLLRKWYSKNLKYYWLSAIPFVLSIILGCWLAPLSISFEGRRYLYPVVYTLPIMLMLCLSMYQKKYRKVKHSSARSINEE